jgi:hypothetical protein
MLKHVVSTVSKGSLADQNSPLDSGTVRYPTLLDTIPFASNLDIVQTNV